MLSHPRLKNVVLLCRLVFYEGHNKSFVSGFCFVDRNLLKGARLACSLINDKRSAQFNTSYKLLCYGMISMNNECICDVKKKC